MVDYLIHMNGTTESRIIPQERDFAVLPGLFEARTRAVGYAAILYFEGNMETAKKRIRLSHGRGRNVADHGP